MTQQLGAVDRFVGAERGGCDDAGIGGFLAGVQNDARGCFASASRKNARLIPIGYEMPSLANDVIPGMDGALAPPPQSLVSPLCLALGLGVG